MEPVTRVGSVAGEILRWGCDPEIECGYDPTGDEARETETQLNIGGFSLDVSPDPSILTENQP